MMLAFSSLSDAHFHLVYSAPLKQFSVPYYAVTCAHDTAEFEAQKKLVSKYNSRKDVMILNSFGMHPQMPVIGNADFMETLLREQQIQIIGEAGFDLFTKDLKADIAVQEQAWSIQTVLAAQYNVPLVVHCRKGIDRIFRDSRILRQLPAVIFHSFQGSPADAQSLLRHGINAYFSFGKPVLKGDKSAISCIRELGTERILMETDAPYQTLKGETTTGADEIVRVYEVAFILQRKQKSADEFSSQILTNFKSAYGIA
jgi:TatD DNase family protein